MRELEAILTKRHRERKFESVWRTTTSNEVVDLPLANNLTQRGTIDWGDGNESPLSYANRSHTYVAIGDYTVTLRGQFDFGFTNPGSNLKLISVPDITHLKLDIALFKDCTNLTTIGGGTPYLSTTNLTTAFISTGVLTTGNLNDINTSKITDLTNTFRSSAYNGSLNSWDVSNVTTLSSTFILSAFNQPLNLWDVSKVTTFFNLFYQCAFRQPLNDWVTTSLESLQNTFFATAYDQPLSNWDTSNVITMSQTFRSNTAFNQDISSWNTSSCGTMNGMFYNASAFNQPLNAWNVSNVTNVGNMFRDSGFNQPLNLWDTSSFVIMNIMFANCPFNQDISMWDFSSVTNISDFMFGKTDLDYTASYYDNLLIKWDNAVGGLVFANMTNVNIGMGAIKYTSAGATARASLVTKGFILIDGGLV